MTTTKRKRAHRGKSARYMSQQTPRIIPQKAMQMLGIALFAFALFAIPACMSYLHLRGVW